LVLRVQAVLRRSINESPSNETIILDANTAIDCLNMSGNAHGKVLAFTRREIDLLQYLEANSHRPVSRDELLSKVWGYADDLDLETRTVDIHIAKLRRKIETNSATPAFLVTVRGAGYKLICADNNIG